MKIHLIILLLLLLLPLCYSEIEFTQLISKEVTNQEEIVTDGNTFAITIIDDSRARVTFPDDINNIMQEGECEQEGDYTFCITDIKSGEEYAETSSFDLNKHFNQETNEYNLFANIVIKKPKTGFSITRTFEKTELLIGETVRVNVAVTNSGSTGLQMRYEESYPGAIEVTEAWDCVKAGNSLTWEGNLGIGKTKEFYYFIRGVADIKFRSTINLNVDGEDKEYFTDLIVEGSPIDLTSTIPKNISLGKEADITITINPGEDSASVSNFKYKIYIPEGLRIITWSDELQEKSGYLLLAPNLNDENLSYSIRIKAEKIGKFDVKEEIGYTANNIYNEIAYNNNITVPGNELSMNIPRKSTYTPDEKAEWKITITNNNEGIDFKNLNIDASTDFGTKAKSTSIENVPAKSSIDAMVFPFTVPGPGKYNIEVKLTYETLFREKFTKKEIMEITVKDSTTPQSEKQNQETQSAPENKDEEDIDSSKEKETSIESIYDTIDQYEQKDWIPLIAISSASLLVAGIILFIVFRKKGMKAVSLDEKLIKVEKKLDQDIKKGKLLK